MCYKILIPQDITSAGKDYLKKKGFELNITGRTSYDDLKKDVSDCDAILARTCQYPSDLFSFAPKLKCIARHGSGYDNIDIRAALEHGVCVCITPTAPVNSVAEHTIMLLLSCAENLVFHHRQYIAKKKTVFTETRSEVKNKVLGIIGFGKIGQAVAKKAFFGLNMKVVAYGRTVPSDPEYKDFCTFTTHLEEALSQADYLSIHLPSTPWTRNLFRKDTLWKMKPGSILINTSRGDLIEETILYDVLSKKHLRMAALDVFWEEPFHSQSELLKLDNVIVTPHSAALTHEAMDQMGLLAAQEIERVLAGKDPFWPVIPLSNNIPKD